jgi:hypothetical protein
MWLAGPSIKKKHRLRLPDLEKPRVSLSPAKLRVNFPLLKVQGAWLEHFLHLNEEDSFCIFQYFGHTPQQL